MLDVKNFPLNKKPVWMRGILGAILCKIKKPLLAGFFKQKENAEGQDRTVDTWFFRPVLYH